MNSPRLKNEGWLYWLAFLIALGFRLIQLGALPLTDSEATFALQALHIAQGRSPLLGPQPAYILFTSILFAVIENTNFMARFVPALAGSALAFVSYFFREKIKPRPALILAFLFAVDPGLVALSRQAGGTMLAITFLLFTWGMWINKRIIPAGIFAGLALLSGTSVWAGLLAIGITWLLRQAMESKSTSNNFRLPTTDELRPALFSLVATLLLGGTLFFVAPNGLSAAFASLPAYLSGWVTPSSMTPSRVLFVLLAYEPLGIFLAFLAIVRGYRTGGRRAIRLSLWLGVALLLAVFYRQTSELGWTILPLLTLAARELSRAFDVYPEERRELGLVVLATMILLIYIWFNVANIALNPFNQVPASLPIFGEVQNPRFVIMFGALAILIVCIAMVAIGWSARTARLGMSWSFTLFLGIYSLGSAWGASGLRTPNGVELWLPDQPPLHAALLRASVEEASDLSLGHVDSQPVTIMGIKSAALEWVLRDHAVEVTSILDPQVAPPLVITPSMDDLGLPSTYRGQDFTWRQKPSWGQVKTSDWFSWLVYRQLPRENETIILWVRDDLFPDARKNPAP